MTSLLSILFATALAAPNAVPRPEPSHLTSSTIIASIDQREINLGELMFRFATLPALQRERYLAGGGLEAFLDDLLGSLAVIADAESMGLEEDPLFASLMQLHREQTLAELHARRTILDEIDEADIEARYEAVKKDRFVQEPRIRLRHLLITSAGGRAAAHSKILGLEAKLQSGIALSELARTDSEDRSASDGGDLGWLTPDQLVPELVKAALTLDPGQVSDIVESDLGFHLVELIDYRPAATVPLEVVEELLFQEIVGERWLDLAGRARRQRDALRKGHQVTVHRDRLP